MSAMTPAGSTPYYFIPSPSRHPVLVSFGLLMVIFGAAQWVNGVAWGSYLVVVGMVVWLSVLFQWFSESVRESEAGLYSARIDISYRWSMSWFIFSEVMFFAAFFGALYWARVHSVPMLGNLDHQILWPDFKAIWPSAGPGITASPAGTVEPFASIGPWPLPTINTALLLTSGITLTVAHHALLANQRGKTILWMWITVALGATFLGVQAFEYMHAYRDLNLKLSSGIFGSTFFMLTGFHGFHVIVGTIFLAVCLFRLYRGDFSPRQHFGFEAAAWYWHFVDVVWLFLFAFIYVIFGTP
jgi:cytochrome c oxidase subunit 3